MNKYPDSLASNPELEKRYRLLGEVFEATHDSVMITDAHCNIIAVNKAFTKISGYLPAEVIGENPRLLSSGNHDRSFYQAFWQDLIEKGSWEGEVWNKAKAGHLYLGWLRVSTLRIEKEVYYVGITTDITELHHSRQELEYSAYHDVLTKLPNRLQLYKTLDAMLETANKKNTQVAVLFLDLDNFKHINDSLGHEVGDELLTQICDQVFNENEQDFVARLGGDEFVIIPKLSGRVDFADIAEGYIKSFARSFQVQGNELYSSVSIGVSFFPSDANTSQELVRYADIAMFKAKAKGKNRVEYFKPYMAYAANKRQQIESKFRQALSVGAIDIFFQPQFSVSTNVLSGVEVLVRWYEAELDGWVVPGEFIPIVEGMGLIQELGELVLTKLCAQMKTWLNEGKRFPLVSINVSIFQIERGDFLENFVRIIESYDLKPNMFEVEITESALMLGKKKVLDTLAQLRDLGVVIAIDDFGTGYSSLSYLAKMPVQRLKIDKMFLQNLDVASNNAVLVRMIIALGNTLGINVIAEGVETQAQLEFLQSAGCAQSQGFYHSRALPAEDFERYLSQEMDGVIEEKAF